MPLLVAERALQLIIAFIILFPGEQKIEPQWEMCKDISNSDWLRGGGEECGYVHP